MTDHDSAGLAVGIVLMPDFTMIAFAAFVDTLRLAADDADRSRPLRCKWQVMTADGRPAKASNGLCVTPNSGFAQPAAFDYIVVAGGTLHRDHDCSETYAYLRIAADAGVPLIGICTGGVFLARAGLMAGRRMCISWLHREDVAAEFPDLQVVADELYVWDQDRITCAGGTSVIHLASEIVERHLGTGTAHKGLRIMQEEKPRGGSAPQVPPTIHTSRNVQDPRVRRAVLFMEQTPAAPIDARRIAAALGISRRHLNRIFLAETGLSVAAFARILRLERADQLVRETVSSLTEIAADCGFADAAHFSRSFRDQFHVSPSMARQQSKGLRGTFPLPR